ncbi:MAG: type II secretion system secretin GspD [Hyphomicrobium sp.]
MSNYQRALSNIGAVQAALVAMLCVHLAACALPSEQLLLPGPVGGPSAGSDIGTKAKRFGVPMSNPADSATSEARVYKGSGQFIGDTAGNNGNVTPGGSGRASAAETDAGVTLALSGASAAEAAKVILGDLLKVNYTVSEKVQTKITLNTPQPVSKEALVGIFEGMLRADGAALVVENGLYRIVAAGEGGTGPLVSGPHDSSRGAAPAAGLSNEAVPLRYVAAAEMERVLKSVAPNAKIARVDTARNLLLLTGTPAELQQMRETVSVFDVDWMRGMSVAIHPVETPDPEAITQELDTIFANDRESPVKGIVRFVPNKRLKAVIVISSRPEYLSKAAGWIKRLDMVGAEAEKQVNVYHVQNRPAAELAQLLTKVYAAQKDARAQVSQSSTAPGETPVTLAQGGTGANTQGGAPQTSGGSTVGASGGGQGEPQPLQTFTPETFKPGLSRTPSGPADGSLDTGVQGSGSQGSGAAIETGALQKTPDDRNTGIQVIADEPNNALVITATAQEYKRIRQILSRIDVAPNQVLLEATIAEVTLNDNLKFGLRWYFQSEHNKFKLTDSIIGAVAPVARGFSYFLNTPDVQVALNALATVTDVNIVSSPTLTVMDNKKAILQIGDEVPIVTQQAVSVQSDQAPIVNQVSFRNTGVILNITPRIGDNDRILLDIEQEVSDAVTTTTSGIDAPTIQQRRIKTTVAVNNGESIVLAGMMQDRSTISKEQIPLFGDIPLVGNLFKNKNNTIRRTELLIAITPQVIRDSNQLSGIATEFRDKMNFTTRPQRQTAPGTRENIDRLLVR